MSTIVMEPNGDVIASPEVRAALATAGLSDRDIKGRAGAGEAGFAPLLLLAPLIAGLAALAKALGPAFKALKPTDRQKVLAAKRKGASKDELHAMVKKMSGSSRTDITDAGSKTNANSGGRKPAVAPSRRPRGAGGGRQWVTMHSVGGQMVGGGRQLSGPVQQGISPYAIDPEQSYRGGNGEPIADAGDVDAGDVADAAYGDGYQLGMDAAAGDLGAIQDAEAAITGGEIGSVASQWRIVGIGDAVGAASPTRATVLRKLLDLAIEHHGEFSRDEAADVIDLVDRWAPPRVDVNPTTRQVTVDASPTIASAEQTGAEMLSALEGDIGSISDFLARIPLLNRALGLAEVTGARGKHIASRLLPAMPAWQRAGFENEAVIRDGIYALTTGKGPPHMFSLVGSPTVRTYGAERDTLAGGAAPWDSIVFQLGVLSQFQPYFDHVTGGMILPRGTPINMVCDGPGNESGIFFQAQVAIDYTIAAGETFTTPLTLIIDTSRMSLRTGREGVASVNDDPLALRVEATASAGAFGQRVGVTFPSLTEGAFGAVSQFTLDCISADVVATAAGVRSVNTNPVAGLPGWWWAPQPFFLRVAGNLSHQAATYLVLECAPFQVVALSGGVFGLVLDRPLIGLHTVTTRFAQPLWDSQGFATRSVNAVSWKAPGAAHVDRVLKEVGLGRIIVDNNSPLVYPANYRALQPMR